MHLSTLALSTTNVTAGHNSYCHNTQQAVPNTTHKLSVPATVCLYLKYRACYVSFIYLQFTGCPNPDNLHYCHLPPS